MNSGMCSFVSLVACSGHTAQRTPMVGPVSRGRNSHMREQAALPPFTP